MIIDQLIYYIDSKIVKQAYDVNTTILGLDTTISQTGSDVTDAGNNVNITIVEEDGKLKSVTASVDVFDCGEWK